MFRRYRIRQAALAEWNAHQGDLRALLGGLHSLAYEIVIDGNKRANQETLMAGDGPVVAMLPTTAAAIPILLILQVIQIIVWLYLQWATSKSPPQENDRGEEAAVELACCAFTNTARPKGFENYLTLEEFSAQMNQEWGREGSDGGHIQPTEE